VDDIARCVNANNFAGEIRRPFVAVDNYLKPFPKLPVLV
jgi:hypothetical protein